MALKHVVVDGSNIATEGHNLPTLAQLDEAVSAFLEEYKPETFTVVVDATFGHRIPEAERPAYEEAVLAGEIVSPPAGAVGRGDAFVLQIADRADSVVFSNDSFQEFHGEYTWLFDQGRLIGGKPVPAVGWVFVDRTPVRGPASRKATKDAKGRRRSDSKSKGKSSKKIDVPKVTVPGTKPKVGDTVSTATRAAGGPAGSEDPGGSGKADVEAKATSGDHKSGDQKSGKVQEGKAKAKSGDQKSGKSKKAKREPANPPMPYLEFVETHPVGARVTATVDRFSSHGAYVVVGDIEAYAPLKLMGDPAPRRARDVISLGDDYQFEIHAFDAPNRGIDVALIPDAAPTESAATADEVTTTEPPSQEDPSMAASKKTGAKKSSSKKAPAKKTAAKKAPAKKATTAKKATPAKKTAAKKSTRKK